MARPVLFIDGGKAKLWHVRIKFGEEDFAELGL